MLVLSTKYRDFLLALKEEPKDDSFNETSI